MREMLYLIFYKLQYHKLAPACRYSITPLLCQRRWIAAFKTDMAHSFLLNKFGIPVNATTIMEKDMYMEEYYYEYYDFQIEKSSEENFIRYLYMILFPYLLLFGTIGNVLSVVVLNRYSHNVWSTCLYFMLILPTDIMKLYVECGNDWYSKIHDDQENLSADILLISNATCKVYSFLYNFTIHVSAWVMVVVAVETTIAMRSPEKIYKMCTRDKATAIILLISVLLISLNLHFFWTTGLTIPGDDPTINLLLCTYINELSDYFRDYIWPTINFLVGDVFPLILITICLLVSFPKLRNKKCKIEEQDALLEKYFLDIKTLHELKRATLVVCIGDACVVLLRIIDYILNFLAEKEVINLEYESTLLITATVVTVSYTYMSHKFWMFYSCSSKFRKDVAAIFRKLYRPIVRRFSLKKSTSADIDSIQNAAPETPVTIRNVPTV